MSFSNALPRRAAALVLSLLLAVLAALPGFADYTPPVTLSHDDASVYLFELESGRVIYEQNADVQRPVASLTKMMTGLLLVERAEDINGSLTIPNSMKTEFAEIRRQNGTNVGLIAGENIPRIDLLYALMLPSANDAASVIAITLGGTNERFLSMMNDRAAALGCTNTHFSCSHGLYDDDNYSTARDMARIAAACYANPTLAEVVAASSYTMSQTNYHNTRTIRTTNLLLDPESPYYRDYVIGVKTGFTTKAGRCLVAFASRGEHTYGLVMLGSDLDNIYTECGAILDWALESFHDRVLVTPDEPIAVIPVTGSRQAASLPLYATDTLSGYGHDDDPVDIVLDLPDSLRASVKANTAVGTATVTMNGEIIGTTILETREEVVSDFATDIFSLLQLLPILALILVLLTALTVMASGGKGMRRSSGKRRRR